MEGAPVDDEEGVVPLGGEVLHVQGNASPAPCVSVRGGRQPHADPTPQLAAVAVRVVRTPNHSATGGEWRPGTVACSGYTRIDSTTGRPRCGSNEQ